MEHTPTPWSIVPQTNGSSMIVRHYETGKQLCPKAMRIIAHVLARGNTLSEDEGNAAFILEACNSHAHLQEQLRVAVWALEHYAYRLPKSIDYEGSTARTALEQIKGKVG